MFGYDLFFKKIQYLRNMYNLSLDNMVDIFNTIDIGIQRATIYKWEKQKSIPSMIAVKSYADIFGVDPSWLLNISATPYTIDSIENAEAWFNYYQKYPKIRWANRTFDNIREKITRDEKIKCMVLIEPYTFPLSRKINLMNRYGNYYYRRDTYSLEVRANIINILRIMMRLKLTNAKMHFYDEQVYKLISGSKETSPLFTIPDELNQLAFPYSEQYDPNKKFTEDTF